MDSYNEVRRVRSAMSDAAGHDIRALIAKINERRARVASRVIDPGTEAEQCHAPERPKTRVPNGESTPAAR